MIMANVIVNAVYAMEGTIVVCLARGVTTHVKQ